MPVVAMTKGHASTSPEALARAASVSRLLVLWEAGSASYSLAPEASVLLGRHAECEIVIGLPSVSRRHARVHGGQPPTIEDLGGMNGVRVRGQRIKVGERVPIRPGDVVELGGAMVVMHASRDAKSRAAGGAMARADPYRVDADDPARAVEQLIDLVARSDLGVLLLGETGVGKTVAAEAIHARSARARGPLLRLNCASLSEEYLEDALFGYERVHAGGAREAKPGLVETANSGTLLLDEIGELPLATQAKLLAVIEARQVKRAGSDEPQSIDVRFIGATNRDLFARAAEGAFRLDLYYRLNGISLVIPPLRERTREIPGFATRFLEEAAARAGMRSARLSNDALGVLVRHPFFGNIRELRATMDRACLLAGGGLIGPEHLFFEAPPPSSLTSPDATTWSTMRGESATYPAPPPLSSATAEVVIPPLPPLPGLDRRDEAARPPPGEGEGERDRIVAALRDCNGNQTRAAEVLGMSRKALIARIEQYGLPRPRKR